MPDVSVDYSALESTRRTLGDIGDVLSSSTDAVSDVPSSAVAQDVLRDRLQSMGGFWGSSLRRLSSFASDAGKGLEGIVTAFQDFDAELAAGMEPEGGQS